MRLHLRQEPVFEVHQNENPFDGEVALDVGHAQFVADNVAVALDFVRLPTPPLSSFEEEREKTTDAQPVDVGAIIRFKPVGSLVHGLRLPPFHLIGKPRSLGGDFTRSFTSTPVA